MKCLVTICSKKKDPNSELLPAHTRYLGEHIQKTFIISKELKLPLYILSGKYGLIPAEEKIPDYDYYLENTKVVELSINIADQIKTFGITSIDFYIEDKESWQPYIKALELATVNTQCELRKEKIDQKIVQEKDLPHND